MKDANKTPEGALASPEIPGQFDYESSGANLKTITDQLRQEETTKAFLAGQASASDLIDDLFKYHAPESREQLLCYQQVRQAARNLAHVIDDLVPAGADRSHAIRQLRDCVMWANGAIALKGKSYR